MASIVLLLSELLGGESASVLAANRYIGGGASHRSHLGEFRPAVTAASASARKDDRHAAAGTGLQVLREEEKRNDEDSFEDLAVSRVAVDVMWP